MTDTDKSAWPWCRSPACLWIHPATRWRRNIHAVVEIHPLYCAAVHADGHCTLLVHLVADVLPQQPRLGRTQPVAVHRARTGDAAAGDHRRAHLATRRQHGHPDRLRCWRTVDRYEAASHLSADVRQTPSPPRDREGTPGRIGEAPGCLKRIGTQLDLSVCGRATKSAASPVGPPMSSSCCPQHTDPVLDDAFPMSRRHEAQQPCEVVRVTN